jgi:hypothetical protein
MGFLRKVGKKIARGFRKVGRALKKGIGKIGKAFGKLGPLGSLALSFILPGVGTWLTTGPLASVVKPIIDGISAAGNFIKGGVKTVFNKVTDAIEYGINAVSDGSGTQFKNWVSETTKGFVDPSTKELPTDADETIKQDPSKVITETTAEESTETIKDKLKEVKGRYKKIQAVSSASNVFTEQEEAEQFNQAYQSKQFADIALENLGIQNSRRYGAGVSDMMFIDLDRAGNSSNPSLSIYDDILKGIPISNNMTAEQIFSTVNTYPQIQT